MTSVRFVLICEEVIAIQTRSGIEVYRQADAARRLKVTRQRIQQMILAGELAYVDEDGFRLVCADSMRTCVEKRRRRAKLGLR